MAAPGSEDELVLDLRVAAPGVVEVAAGGVEGFVGELAAAAPEVEEVAPVGPPPS